MDKISRVFGLNHVKEVSRIKGVPVIFVRASYDGLISKSMSSVEFDVSIIVYEKKPLSAIDSTEFKVSGRAQKTITRLIKDYLERWNGNEFNEALSTADKDSN